MRGGNPKDISEILAGLKQGTALGEQLEQALIWDRWPELAGPQLCARGAPKSLKDGKLTIEAESSVWAHKFTYRKGAIIRRINTMVRREMVSEIFVRLREDESPGVPQDDV